jgi:hypothetical protein
MLKQYSEREKREIREDLIAALDATHPNPKKQKAKQGTHNG